MSSSVSAPPALPSGIKAWVVGSRPRTLPAAIVPVGITKHRAKLTNLRTLTSQEAQDLIVEITALQNQFDAEIGRGFVYLSDEMFILADQDFPMEDRYDGFPLMENGVGMCRDFLTEFDMQQQDFTEEMTPPKRLTMVTSTLPAGLLANRILPQLNAIKGLTVDLVVAENKLFGESVTVSGLLSYKCYHAALKGQVVGDLVLLPPDSLNFEGLFMDNKTPEQLSETVGAPVKIFGGDWLDVLEELNNLEAIIK